MRDIPESRMITPEPHLNRFEGKYSFIFFSPFFCCFLPANYIPVNLSHRTGQADTGKITFLISYTFTEILKYRQS